MVLLDVFHYLDLAGVAVFAISGSLAAADKRQDILGFVLFGTVTGVGGGTLRDLLLGAPVFWLGDTSYVWICIAASVATWFFARFFVSLENTLLWADAMGLALFCVLGTQKALSFDAPVIVAVGMGMMTASFGSLIRDTLLRRPPVLLEPDIYVTAALLGSASYVALISLGVAGAPAMLVAVAAAFALRAAAIRFDLRLKKYDDSN